MRTIQELLANHPEALAHVERLTAAGDVWIVGGAARALLYPLPFPQDVDLLINTDKTVLTETEKLFLSSNEQGQKVDISGVKLDVFGNQLTVWLRGVPCYGDGLAIRARDHFALLTEGFVNKPWTKLSPTYGGAAIRPDYLERHQASLQRDMDAISALAASEFSLAVLDSMRDGDRS